MDAPEAHWFKLPGHHKYRRGIKIGDIITEDLYTAIVVSDKEALDSGDWNGRTVNGIPYKRLNPQNSKSRIYWQDSHEKTVFVRRPVDLSDPEMWVREPSSVHPDGLAIGDIVSIPAGDFVLVDYNEFELTQKVEEKDPLYTPAFCVGGQERYANNYYSIDVSMIKLVHREEEGRFSQKAGQQLMFGLDQLIVGEV